MKDDGMTCVPLVLTLTGPDVAMARAEYSISTYRPFYLPAIPPPWVFDTLRRTWPPLGREVVHLSKVAQSLLPAVERYGNTNKV